MTRTFKRNYARNIWHRAPHCHIVWGGCCCYSSRLFCAQALNHIHLIPSISTPTKMANFQVSKFTYELFEQQRHITIQKRHNNTFSASFCAHTQSVVFATARVYDSMSVCVDGFIGAYILYIFCCTHKSHIIRSGQQTLQ